MRIDTSVWVILNSHYWYCQALDLDFRMLNEILCNSEDRLLAIQYLINEL